MQEMTLYKIRNNEDKLTLGYTRDFDTAKAIAKGRGFWGFDASISTEIIKIFDSIEDYIQTNAANS